MLEAIGYKTYISKIILPSYQSDFDLLLILKKGKYAGHQARELQYTIEKRLDKNSQLL